MADPILYTAWSALNASQYAISVHSNNVSNADTEGYHRQTVSLSEAYVVDTANGGLGLGVDVDSVQRAMNQYLEEMFLAEWTNQERWSTQAEWMGYVENTFHQSDATGVNSALAAYFQSWDDLAANPDDESARSALLGTMSTLNTMLADMAGDLERQTELIESQVMSEVGEVNAVTRSLADLNATIREQPDNLSLLDQRDALVRELSGYMDVEVQYYDSGEISVFTGAGQPLVDGSEAYEIQYHGPQTLASTTAESTFDGTVWFEGASSDEIVLEVVDAGTADGGVGAARFKVSLDGGQTWLADESGSPTLYTADAQSGAVEVDGVEIWFGGADDASATGGGILAAGDSFTVMAKSGIYWHQNTSTFENITPLAASTGGDVDSRLTGGSLAGLLSTRDAMIGDYARELDAFANSLIWETNFAFSQGAGLTNFTSVTGTYAARESSVSMSESGLDFADRLQAGGFSIALYDESTGDALGVTAVDFSTIVPPGTSTFDPAVHSLDDVAQAMNDTFAGQLTATVTNGVLSVDAADGVGFQFAGDTTGILAACGLNTLFTGTGASDIGVDSVVSGDPNRINAGKVDASGAVAQGSNETAEALAGLRDKDVSVIASDGTISTMSLSGYLNALVAGVGADAAAAQSNESYFGSLAEELRVQQDSVSGVNLDEELIKIEQYQRLYQSAANMIQVSNEMFETLMSIA